jgi:hypothetical protein
MTEAVFRGVGVDFCRAGARSGGIIAFWPGGLDGVSRAGGWMLTGGLACLLISCLLIFG